MPPRWLTGYSVQIPLTSKAERFTMFIKIVRYTADDFVVLLDIP